MTPTRSTPAELPPELIARLSCLFEEFQLADLIESLEVAREAGHGFAEVTVRISNYSSVEIAATFTRKPRPSQSDWVRGR